MIWLILTLKNKLASPFNKHFTHFNLNNEKALTKVSAKQNWHLPNLPGRFHPSTFGVYRLNYCVRYGNRWYPIAIDTRSVCL